MLAAGLNHYRRCTGRGTIAGLLLSITVTGTAAGQSGMSSQSVAESARTPGGLVEALYGMVSFGPGPEPDWEMFRDVFLEEAVIVFSPRGDQPMRVMTVDGFIQDWKDFFRDARLEDRGFYETIAGLKVDEFGGLAHAWVIFEPRIGDALPDPQIRGLDSIELSFDGQRWWVAAITTDFEAPGQTIPGGLVPR